MYLGKYPSPPSPSYGSGCESFPPLLPALPVSVWGGGGLVADHSFPIPPWARPCFPPLWQTTSTSSLTCPFLLLLLSLLCILLALLGLGRHVSALPHKLAFLAGVVGLAALPLHSLAHQPWPAFASGINGRTLRWSWRRGMSRRGSPPPPPSVPNLDCSNHLFNGSIFVFNSPLFIGVVSLTPRLIPSMYWFSHTQSRRAILRNYINQLSFFRKYIYIKMI